MVDNESTKAETHNPQSDVVAETSETAQKPALSLSRLSSRFADARREAPKIPDLTYAEQIQSGDRSTTLEPELPASVKKPAQKRGEGKAAKPFSKFDDEELGKRITIRLPETVDRALRIHAAANATLVTNVVATAIEDYMNKHGIKV